MADLVITPANVFAGDGANSSVGTAGEAITAGELLYKKAADGKMWLAIDTAAASAAIRGVALNNADPDQPISYLVSGPLTAGAATVVGVVYGATDTAGGISDVVDRASGDYVSILGIGISITVIQVDVQNSGVAIA